MCIEPEKADEMKELAEELVIHALKKSNSQSIAAELRCAASILSCVEELLFTTDNVELLKQQLHDEIEKESKRMRYTFNDFLRALRIPDVKKKLENQAELAKFYLK